MPGQTKTIDPGRAFGLLHCQGESMTFEQAKYKYNCYARDILGLVGEIEQPSLDTSKKVEMPLIDPGRVVWLLKNYNDQKIAVVDSKRRKVLI
jgi:hypothetical protein